VTVESHFRRSRTPFRCRRGFVAVLAAFFLGFSSYVRAQTSPCALTGDTSVSTADITAAINMALGIIPCTANVEGTNTCTVITVQRVVNAYLGQPCSVWNAHAANLSWTASTTPGVTYNIYRASASTGPFTTPLNSSPISGLTFTDTSVLAGQTYYYVVTAVASNNSQSADSSPPIPAAIPYP
jgi:hypothetical protein